MKGLYTHLKDSKLDNDTIEELVNMVNAVNNKVYVMDEVTEHIFDKYDIKKFIHVEEV